MYPLYDRATKFAFAIFIFCKIAASTRLCLRDSTAECNPLPQPSLTLQEIFGIVPLVGRCWRISFGVDTSSYSMGVHPKLIATNPFAQDTTAEMSLTGEDRGMGGR